MYSDGNSASPKNGQLLYYRDEMKDESTCEHLQSTEDPLQTLANGFQASPLKLQLEPDESINETQVNRKTEVEEVLASGSDEEALRFFEQMEELMRSQDTLPYEFTMELDEIIKSCGITDLSDPLGMTSAGLSGEHSFQGAGASSLLDGLERFDFSTLGVSDDGHKIEAATPDLVAPSSTNSGPSFGSEAQEAHGPPTL
ncbi:hypothetical protein NLI96_g10718 [Meripilus lineatus]|uniref:Uncharacterized protein n=1 Tax=Meripilus lineatus TaxID=2056292 RepID=A0AAD5YE29_9APHY|nr:hypothetical protein NLI96_g10718 [Physisporinus lineatus]